MFWWALLFYAGGTVLVLAEFIVPGGICGAVGGLFILISCIVGCYGAPDHVAFVIILEAVGIVISIVLGFTYLPRTRLARRLILEDSQDAAAGWVAVESNERLVGRTAEVLTALRPAGTILVDGERLDAVSDGQFIDKGAAVRVLEVHGSRVVVEQVRENAKA
ncbi:MAG TPA: NfeD family protein [Candidatus Hydrogenedentes bacterium]|nr:NfeD family protein [Candidatus Hydrogenedentota bacterium]HPG67263.1 NfeD family protein [Candidatus Hydrogenedentota bacterium]